MPSEPSSFIASRCSSQPSKAASPPAGGRKTRTSWNAPTPLLDRIREQRQDCYEAALREWERALNKGREKGGKSKRLAKPKAPKRYSTDHSRLGLPDLPRGWAWSYLGCSSTGPEYGTAAKSSTQGEVPVVRMGNIQNGRIDWADLVYTSDKEEIARYSLEPGDVLFNRTNSPELVGKTAIYRGRAACLVRGLPYTRQSDQPSRLGTLRRSFLEFAPGTGAWKIREDGRSKSVQHQWDKAPRVSIPLLLPPPNKPKSSASSTPALRRRKR